MSCKYLGQSKVFVGECKNQSWRGTLTGADNTVTLEYDSKSIEVPLVVLEELLHAIYEVDPMVSSGAVAPEDMEVSQLENPIPNDIVTDVNADVAQPSLVEPAVPPSRPTVKMDNTRRIKPRV